MTDKSQDAEIRAVLAAWAEAIEAKDVPRITAFYPEDIVAFDAILALRFVGRQAYEDHWNACLAYSSGPMIFQIHDLGLEASGDVAFCHALVRCGGTGPDGEVKSGWMRMTLGLRREAGGWRIVHEHHSAPFDMESFKALFELEPEGDPKALVA